MTTNLHRAADLIASFKQLSVDQTSSMRRHFSLRSVCDEVLMDTKLGKGGSGLGMHIVYSLVTQSLGGEVEVHSQPGQGTECRFVLPLRAPEAEA